MPANAAHIVHTEMMRAMGRAVSGLRGGVGKYPPKPEGSKYRRTGTLGRSLTSFAHGDSIHSVKRIAGGVEGRWGTNVKYAPYVIDQNSQAWMHKGRWWTLQGEAKRMTPQVKAEFEAASVRIANKLGPMWTKTIVIEVNL